MYSAILLLYFLICFLYYLFFNAILKVSLFLNNNVSNKNRVLIKNVIKESQKRQKIQNILFWPVFEIYKLVLKKWMKMFCT